MSEEKNLILYLDDQPSQRKILEFDLRDLFGADYRVQGLDLQQRKEGYVDALDNPAVLGVFIDHRLTETGVVTGYNGVELCEYLRAIFAEMPIYLVTGFDADDSLQSEKAGSAEALVYKKELRAETYESKCLKQRFLRHAQRFQDSLNKRQKRFRLLLEQSVLRALSVDEQTEFEKLQQSRLVPTQAVEQQQIPSIQKDIAEIEDLLRKLGTIPPKNEK